MATKSELRDRAAQDLGKLRLNGTLQDQDKTRIEAAYDEVYDELKDKGLATWVSDGDVPSRLVPYVSGLMALNCLLTYSVSQERQAAIYRVVGVDGNLGRLKIRELTTPKYVSDDSPEDF